MSAEMIEESPSYGPFITAVLYYTLVLGIAELSRRALDRIFSKSSTIHRFFIEFIGTVTICVCVFENGVILVNYGIWAFFIVSTILGYFFGTLGRGAFGTPMGPVEQFIYGEMPLSKLLILFVAEFLGGAFAWRITMELWRQSLYYTGTHFEFYKNSLNDCDLHHKHAFYIMIAFEIFGAFVMRTVIPKIPEKVANFLIPAFISGIFSFSIMYIGDAGLDPIVASSLFYGCRGLSQQWFILQYWICPIIGWLLAAALDRRSRVKAKKPKKETVKKEGKNKPVKKEKQQ